MGSGPRILVADGGYAVCAPFDAYASYPEISPAEMCWVLIVAADPGADPVQEEGS